MRLSEKYELPLQCGGWYYVLGADEQLLFDHLKRGARSGTMFHNVQIKTMHADGSQVTNEQIVDIILRASDVGDRVGCLPCFEVHVNMWSEDFIRIEQVANEVTKRGSPFRMTLDHSHIVFKMDNKEEQALFGLAEHIKAGRVILDPFVDGHLAQTIYQNNWVHLIHARSAVPDNPKNIWARHPDGSVGRGVQYPFIKPQNGEYHSPWEERRLEPWKDTVRQALRHHARDDNSPLKCISTEFLAATDYGEGCTYSLLANSVACAKWLRAEISAVQ